MPRSVRRAVLLVLLWLVVVSGAARADESRSGVSPGPAASPSGSELPPLPEGVTALQFADFFVRPVGPRGLVFTEKLLGLEGSRVRILGYMVRRDSGPPGTLLLVPHPIQLHDHEYGLADDLPATTLTVIVPDVDEPLPHTPGLLLLTGRLELGSREEADGRISSVRLVLDPGAAGQGPLTSAVREQGGP